VEGRDGKIDDFLLLSTPLLHLRGLHRIGVEGRDGKIDDFLLLSTPLLHLRGLHTKGLRCNPITVGCGCLAIIRESAACVGLPANLLRLLSKEGVVSIVDVVGVNKLEYRAFLLFLLIIDW
jgi:hypothetical protein